MRRMTMAVTLLVILLDTGCFWRTQHDLQARITTDLQDIGQQAEQVLADSPHKPDYQTFPILSNG